MKHFSTALLCLIFICKLSLAQTSNCADSVRTSYYYHAYNWSPEYIITIDTFNLDSGFVTTCINTGVDPNQMNGFTCSLGYWSKYVYTYDAQNRITEKKLITGSATGWKDSFVIAQQRYPVAQRHPHHQESLSLRG